MSFCTKCGKELPLQAMYCPACGAGVGQPTRRKNKIIAVLLAVSLSWWTWLYTYKRDAWKFWLGLAVGVFSAGLTFAYIINVFADVMNMIGLAMSGSLSEMQLGGSISGWTSWVTVASIAGFGIWVWTIVDTAVKSGEWYNFYYA